MFTVNLCLLGVLNRGYRSRTCIVVNKCIPAKAVSSFQVPKIMLPFTHLDFTLENDKHSVTFVKNKHLNVIAEIGQRSFLYFGKEGDLFQKCRKIGFYFRHKRKGIVAGFKYKDLCNKSIHDLNLCSFHYKFC